MELCPLECLVVPSARKFLSHAASVISSFNCARLEDLFWHHSTFAEFIHQDPTTLPLAGATLQHA